MNEYHRLGIKNFKSIRHLGQIKLAFDLCTDDISAPQYVSFKGNDSNKKIQISNNDKLKFDYIPIKKSTNNWLQNCQCSKILMNFIMNIFYLFFRILCIILKYTIYLIWYLFKILLYIIFRLLTESKLYCSKSVLCHPIRCYHHRF
ncbi:unnamed protein product [Rotaria sordida]|uniref:Uncharacterized protein n=1 Tax=Rotaria sordida TaxID=392033 RepID=A0A815D4U6_9BILA|nr:unnamed protein product [Rotaria sordida]